MINIWDRDYSTYIQINACDMNRNIIDVLYKQCLQTRFHKKIMFLFNYDVWQIWTIFVIRPSLILQ